MDINELQIKEVVKRVVEKYVTADFASQTNQNSNEILLETSARHIHLTNEAVERLFGKGSKLTVKRYLSQPGEFLSDQRVNLVTPKGTIENVAVLGPTRKAVQVELSNTDCKSMGIKAPVNMSGDLTNAGDVLVVAKNGFFEAKQSVIIAKAHIHLTPKDATKRNLKNGQKVSVKIKSKRPLTIDDVVVRVNEKFAEAMHIDFDESNACNVEKDTTAEILYWYGII